MRLLHSICVALAVLFCSTAHAQYRGGVNVYAGIDADQDGIRDALEAQLLARFTPYLRFSDDGGEDQYRPMDAIVYLRWSALQASGSEGSDILTPQWSLQQDPMGALQQGTNIMEVFAFRGDRYLDPYEDVPQPGGNWARHGYAWADVLASRNVGLYGHVVPFRAAQPYTDFLQCTQSHTPNAHQRDQVLCNIDANGGGGGRTYYKIEYWQFFGYNGQGKPFDLGDHEGDWCSVQVIVDSETLEPLQVHMFAHGYRIGFELRQARAMVDLDGGLVREYRGDAHGEDIHFSWHDTDMARDGNAHAAIFSQTNVLQMMRDPDSGAYEHPVVYVEHGGHEFWPTAGWSYQDARNHNGEDRAHSYLAAAPPNLGEVEHPLAETAFAAIILQYNGRWGTYSRRNDPPQGPALHNGWTWPESSSIRWQLPKDLGN